MKVDGSCHCGSISFVAEIETGRAHICHCDDCQMFSGGAFRVSIRVREQDFKLLTGRPKIYVKTSEGGKRREQAFCPNCGTSLYSTSVGTAPRNLGVRVSILNQKNEFKPTRQFWCRSAQSWLSELAQMPGHETQ